MDFVIPTLIGLSALVVIVILIVRKEKFIATLGRPFVQMGYSDYPGYPFAGTYNPRSRVEEAKYRNFNRRINC